MVDEEFFSAETIGKATSFKPQATREGVIIYLQRVA